MIDPWRCVPLGFRAERCRSVIAACSANAGPRDNTGAPAFPSIPRRDAAAASGYPTGASPSRGAVAGLGVSGRRVLGVGAVRR